MLRLAYRGLTLANVNHHLEAQAQPNGPVHYGQIGILQSVREW